MKLYTTIAAIAAATTALTQAAITWTGAVDSDLTNDGNWDFSGSGLASVAGIDSGTVADDLVIGNAGTSPVFGDLTGQPTWGTTAAFGITLDNATIDNGSGNDGFGFGTISLTNGSSLTTFFVDGTLNVDATSSVNLEGAGDPIPGATAVNLAVGATITLSSVAEYTEQGSQIFVNGVNYATDSSILDFSGTTATAVPEPSSSALLGLGALALILRRRK